MTSLRLVSIITQILSTFVIIVYSIFIGNEVVTKFSSSGNLVTIAFIIGYCVFIITSPFILLNFGKALIRSSQRGLISENELQHKIQAIKEFVKTMSWTLFFVITSGSIVAAYYPKTGTFMVVAATMQDRLLGKVDRLIDDFSNADGGQDG